MGYPQPASVNVPIAQESISGVLTQSYSQLEEVEKRLQGLLDRIQSRGTLNKDPGNPPMTPGVLSQAVSVRNISARLNDCCAQLDVLL